MSRRTSLRMSSWSASRYASPTGPHQNSSPVTSTPVPVDRQPGPSNVHLPSTSQSIPKSTGIPHDDEEKQLSGADQPFEREGDPSHLEVKPPGLPQGNQKATVGNDPSAPPDPNKTGPSNLDQYADFWNSYNKLADKEDEELIKSFAGDLDTLLIFAGLFSATNTAFIVESYKDLKQDPSELTNNLLRNMMRTIHQSSFTEADLLLDYGGPPTPAIVVNLFFFASLCCSLFTASTAMVGKQWLNHYGRDVQLSSPSARGIERQRKHMGLEKWKFQAVVETLPTLLHFALFFFFIGLIEFMWPLNILVGTLILLLSVLTLLFYVVTLLIGILYPNSPFQTRLTNVLRKRFAPKKAAPNGSLDTTMDVLRGQCVDWLQQRTTFSETIGIISRAITLLTQDAKKAINLDRAGAMLAYVLRSSFSNGRVYLGISAEGLQSSLVALKDVISRWSRDNDIVHIEDIRNASFLQVLSRELWNLLLKTGTMDEIETSTTLGILEKLGPVNWEDSRDSRATYLIESLGKPLSYQDQLIRLDLLRHVLMSNGAHSAGAMLSYILRSSFPNDRVFIGISAEVLQTSLIVFKDVIFQWDKGNDIVHMGDTSNVSFLQVLDRGLWDLLIKSSTMDEIASSAALVILENLGPINLEYSRQSRATFLIESLGKRLTPQGQLAGLALLTDALWSDGQDWLYGGVDAYVTNIHMREVLSTTMWGVDGKPDLDDQRVVLRLSWFLDDTDGMHPQIPGRDFDRYLSLWLKSDVQPNPSVPLKPVFRGMWYLRTLIRLLLHDQERWAKQLDEHGHLTHIEVKQPDGSILSNAQFLAFIMLAYVAGRNDDPNAPPSQYYSQARVDRVVQQLRDAELLWVGLSAINLQPKHVDCINQSLSGYIQTAHQYKRIPDNQSDELSLRVKDVMDCIARLRPISS